MIRIIVILGRLTMILVGYAVAALAASASLHIVWLGGAGEDPSRMLAADSMLISVPFVALFIAYAAFVPAAIAIGLAELAGWRDWLAYALSGAAVAIVSAAANWSMGHAAGMPRPITGDTAVYLVALVAAGLVSGIAYWAVCGRWASAWRAAPRDEG